MDITRILVAEDFSPASAAALELAADLARRFHAAVDVLHVFDQPLPPFGESDLPTGSEPALTYAEIVREKTSAHLHRCIHTLRRRGLTVDGRVEIGDPAQVILAASGDYDLIVMGTHGRTGLSRLVNGSVAEEVVRRSRCPVLTARPQPAGATGEVTHGG